MKALIVGAGGQLGRGLAATAPEGVKDAAHDLNLTLKGSAIYRGLASLMRLKNLITSIFGATAFAGAAHAQVGEAILLPPVVPSGFDRGHNQSVLELPRKEYDPAGIRIASFDFLPSVRSGAGGTTNTYYTVDPISSSFLTTTPSAQLISQWNRHQLVLSGTGTFREFVGQPRRNETTWQADERIRVDLGRFSSFTLEEISSQLTENQFSGETTPTVAALSRYRRDFISARLVNQVGRTRFTLAADYATFRFQPLPLLSGETRSQTNRDRNIARFTGQAEYARSPSLAFFVQGSYAEQGFETKLTSTLPNLDSTAYRMLSGLNFDDPGFARGSFGVGYTHQEFSAAIYKSVGGFSFQGRLEMFPSRLTTVTLETRRSIEVTSLSSSGAFWDNRVTARVDREIWRGIIVSTSGAFIRQTFVSSGVGSNSYQFEFGGKYLSSRRISLDATIDYSIRGASANDPLNVFDEFRGELGLTFKI